MDLAELAIAGNLPARGFIFAWTIKTIKQSGASSQFGGDFVHIKWRRTA